MLGENQRVTMNAGHAHHLSNVPSPDKSERFRQGIRVISLSAEKLLTSLREQGARHPTLGLLTPATHLLHGSSNGYAVECAV
jgi:hypothetical protein